MIEALPERPGYTPLSRMAEKILARELVWPLPLLAVGVLGIGHPLAVVPALLLALAPWIARRLARARLSQPAFLGGPLALLGISALVGVWAAYDRSLSWPMLLTLLGSMGLFFAIVHSRATPRQMGGALVATAILLALYLISQYAYFGYEQGVGRPAALGRLTGRLLPDLVFFVPHPNAAAAFLAGAWPLGLVLARRGRGPRRWAWRLALALMAYALLISGSRGAWVGLAFALGVWGLLLVPSRRLRLALGIGMIIGGTAGAYLAFRLIQSGQPVFFLTAALDAAAGRLALYRNGLNLWADYPLTGIGLGDTFGMVYSRYQLLIHVAFLTYSHNLFLAVALGQGALGLAALIWLLLSFYHFVACAERAGTDPGTRPFFRAAWLGTTATFVHGLADSPQFSHSRWTMPMVFALLGIAVLAGRPTLIGTGGEGKALRTGWALPAAIGITLMALGLVLRGSLASTWHTNLGAVYQTWAELSPAPGEPRDQATLARAVTHFRQALRIDPTQPAANRRLGMIALDRGNYPAAVRYLERAYSRERGNQATLKALGYACMYTGRLDEAEALFRQVELQSQLLSELGYWSMWWAGEGRYDLSSYAGQMVRRLIIQK